MRDYKTFFKEQNKAQLEKLTENEHKGSIDIPLNQCIEMLNEEFIETQEAFKKAYSSGNPTIEDIEALRHEFADGGNVNGFGIKACNKIIRSMKGEPEHKRQPTKSKGKPLKVYLSEKEIELIARFSKATDRSSSGFMRHAALTYMRQNKKKDSQGIIRPE